MSLFKLLKSQKITSVVLAVLFIFCFASCETTDLQSSNISPYSSQESLVTSVISENSATSDFNSANTDTQSVSNTNTQSVNENSNVSSKTDTVSVSSIPKFSGNAYVALNNNIPNFSSSELTTTAYEKYSELDNLGRCGVALASCGKEIMPKDGEERGSISSIKPTGWVQAQYDNVSGKNLYNRCHLIGWQLSAENANKKNLITGTRYMNTVGMLPFENMVADYIDETNNHVAYRITPIYNGNNLVASGVQMEAYSIEDNGEGICFNVYCYNVQPDIVINYADGTSGLAQNSNTPAQSSSSTSVSSSVSSSNTAAKTGVYRTPTGKRYHLDPDCGGKNSYEVTLNDAKSAGLTPCQKCAQ